MAAAAGTAALGGTLTQAKETTTMNPKKVTLPKYKNADFYKDGKFQPDAAKKAYLDMMESHGYDMHLEHAKKWATDVLGHRFRPRRFRQRRHGRRVLGQLPGAQLLRPRDLPAAGPDDCRALRTRPPPRPRPRWKAGTRATAASIASAKPAATSPPASCCPRARSNSSP